MSEMQDKESIELFVESMKKAASCARQMATATQNKAWTDMAVGFDSIRAKAVTIYRNRTPSQQERLRMVDALVDKQAIAKGNETVQ